MLNIRRSILSAVVIVGVLLASAVPAVAHTGFESSDPTDQTIVDEPLDQITLVFSGEAEPAGEGFVVLDADGLVRSPDEVASLDNLTWTLGFDEPLAGGTIGVRWSVAAPDAHPISGSFSFTVTAAIPEDPVVAPTTVPSAAVIGTQPEQIPGDVALDQSDPEALDSTSPASTLATQEGVAGADQTQDLETFLDTGGRKPSGAGPLGVLGRIIGLTGATVGIGALAFAALVMRGDHGDIRSVLFWVRRAGVLLPLGAIIEFVAQIAVADGRWSALWSPSAIGDVAWSEFGIALALRIGGGVLLAVGARLEVRDAHAKTDLIVTINELASVGAGPTIAKGVNSDSEDGLGGVSSAGEPYAHDEDQAWHFQSGAAAFGGAVLLLASFVFDGHTVSEGARWFHSLINVLHVTAAAVWAGGLLMLVHVVWRRHRRGADTRALQLAVRFSVVAAIALVGAGLGGLVLAVIVLDSVSELWSTPWGRLLVAKVLVVAVAGIAGGYNHKVLIPEMLDKPGDVAMDKHFRLVVSAEAATLAMVIILTAFLVGAAS